MKKQISAIYCVLVMLTTWCVWNSVNNGNVVTLLTGVNNQQRILTRQVADLIDRATSLELKQPEIVVPEVIVPEIKEGDNNE